MSSIKVIVASHKPYWMPDGKSYLPVQVGAAGKALIPSFQRDDEGENISTKNPNYCELTGMYWAWKNIESDYVGLVHYRRHFAQRISLVKKNRVATGEFLLSVAERRGIILPVERNYYIETGYDQYVHAHHARDLEITREVIDERCPEYLEAYESCMARTHGHRFNMFVMRYDLFDFYCEWLFGILFEVEHKLDISAYSANDARVFGYIAERLLDPWIEANNITYSSLPVVHLESQHWPRKATTFLARKVRAIRKEEL